MSYRAPYWVTFSDRAAICIETETRKQCEEKAKELGAVISIHHLPYPASPRLDPTDCPDFCYSPRECAGRSSCPKSYACSE